MMPFAGRSCGVQALFCKVCEMDFRQKVQQLVYSAPDRKLLFEHEAKQFLRDLGVGVPRGLFVRRSDPLPPEPADLHYPLVVKVVSSRITSKSDASGIRLDIRDREELQRAVAGMLLIEHAEGVLVEEMVPPGFEVIVGGTNDADFGPIVMYGLGGIFVEVFQDISFALAPVDEMQALWLINETKGRQILHGVRGRPPLDVNALARIIGIVSRLIATGVFEEIDLYPFALYPGTSMVLDAKMTVR